MEKDWHISAVYGCFGKPFQKLLGVLFVSLVAVEQEDRQHFDPGKS